MTDKDTLPELPEDVLAEIDALLAELDPWDTNAVDCPPVNVINDGNVVHALNWAGRPT